MIPHWIGRLDPAVVRINCLDYRRNNRKDLKVHVNLAGLLLLLVRPVATSFSKNFSLQEAFAQVERLCNRPKQNQHPLLSSESAAEDDDPIIAGTKLPRKVARPLC